MTTKTKTRKPLDCVAFKRHVQHRLIEEYDARRHEFASYVEFLKAKVGENEWSRAFWKAIDRVNSD